MIVDDTFFLRHRISSDEHKRKFYVEPHISMRRRTNSIEHCTRASKILPNPRPFLESVLASFRKTAVWQRRAAPIWAHGILSNLSSGLRTEQFNQTVSQYR